MAGLLGELIDVFRVREYFGVATQLRDLARRAGEDATFLAQVRRAMLPLPGEWPGPPPRLDWHGPARRLGRSPGRLAIAATGGSGALASLIGVVKACDELGTPPSVMSFASGAALFAFPMAAGKAPEEVAEFVLGAAPSSWIDTDWRSLLTLLPRQGRGFAGLLRGDRIEASFAELLGDMRLGELRIPAYSPVWNIERNELEYIGPRTHPDLEVARAIRMSVSLPLFFEPVPWRGGGWNDGAIVDIFPVRPLLDIEPACDAVLAVNCFHPHEFAGENASGWKERRWSVMDIADQVVTAQHLQLAREHLARLRHEVPKVVMIDPVPYRRVRRAGFYAEFLDRSAWTEFMNLGRRATLEAMGAAFDGVARRRKSGAKAGSRAQNASTHGKRTERAGRARGRIG